MANPTRSPPGSRGAAHALQIWEADRVGVGAGRPRSISPLEEQQTQRDLDFFINRHEHDPLQKFVLSKKKKNVKKEPKLKRSGFGKEPPRALGPVHSPSPNRA